MRHTYEVTFFFGGCNTTSIFPAYMCKPAILLSVAYSHKALFVTCTKYGCRQFNPWPKGIRPDFYNDLISVPNI